MPSTFTENTGIELIADGEQSGLWGQTTNDNLVIVDRALNGSVNISLSGTTHTLTTASGVLSDGQFAVLVFTGSPSGTNTVTIAPNTAQKTYFVTNSTAQTVVLSQGSGANVSVPAGLSKIVFTNGAGAGAAVFDITNTLSGTFTGNASTATALQTARTFTIGATGKTFNGTANVAWSLAEIGVGTLGQQAANNVNIDGGTIDGTVIGGTTPAAISGTTVVSNADALIHGATVGRGGGAISTNTAMGSGALSSNTTGVNNTANGVQALRENTTGVNNTANGLNALQFNTTGSSNTANGVQALRNNTTGSENTANGLNALVLNTTGTGNTVIGVGAGSALTTGNDNTIIGRIAGTAGLANTVIIGAGTAERMRIDSAGNVGIGTSSPQTPLHLRSATNTTQLSISNTATAVVVNDIVGAIGFKVNDNNRATQDTDFAFIRTLAAETHTGTAAGTALTFGTTPLNSLLVAERLRIDSAGILQSPGGSAFVGTVATGSTLGAIIQRGSNSNGEFVRFADGTQICTRSDANITGLSISGATRYSSPNFTPPAAFVGPFNFVVSINPTDGGGNPFGAAISTDTTNSRYFAFVGHPSATASQIRNQRLLWIGRWF